MTHLHIDLFSSLDDAIPITSFSMTVDWQEAEVIERTVERALTQAQESSLPLVSITYDSEQIILYAVTLNQNTVTYTRYRRSHRCITCGKIFVGQQCRACYNAPRTQKYPRSIWQHVWAYMYELADPDTGQVRYVGCSEHPHIRLRLHEHNAWKESSKKDLWLRDLAKQKKHPLLSVVRKVPYSQRLEEEQKHIQSLLDVGVDLLNSVIWQLTPPPSD